MYGVYPCEAFFQTYQPNPAQCLQIVYLTYKFQNLGEHYTDIFGFADRSIDSIPSTRDREFKSEGYISQSYIPLSGGEIGIASESLRVDVCQQQNVMVNMTMNANSGSCVVSESYSFNLPGL